MASSSKSNRYLTGAAAAFSLALVSVLGFAVPANATESSGDGTTDASTACITSAQELEATGQSGSYACVIPELTDEQKQAAESSKVAEDVVGCYNQTPERNIYGTSSSDVVFSIIYGQANDPVNGTWSNCIDGTFTIGLQTNSHLATVTAYSLLQNAAIDLSGSITMEHMNGILPSNTVDSIGYTDVSGAGFSYSGFLGGTSNGIYSAKMGHMTIKDYGRAHTFELDVDLSTYRFLCQTGEPCLYPDGEEAPVFG